MSTQAVAVPAEKAITWTGLFHLFIVYIVWGSTYLAIRIAVMPGSGFPPFTLAAMRILIGGLILFGVALITRQKLRLSRRDLITLVLSGILLWVGGNGLVTWAEQTVDSGLAALIIGATPIWVAMIEAIIDRRLPSATLVIALLIGFSGIGLLTLPDIAGGINAEAMPTLGVLGAALSWGGGTLLQSRRPVALSPVASSAYQQVFGGIFLAILALIVREPLPTPSIDAWLAWAYLLIFGSVFAFTSFVQAVQMLPIQVVMTYPFVNPVIAVFLGWLILSEPITWTTIGGAALVLVGVGVIFRMRYLRKSPA